MKELISFSAGLIVAFLIFFKLDPWLVEQIISMLDITDNVGLVKVILWIALIFFTGAISILIAILIGILTRIILGE